MALLFPEKEAKSVAPLRGKPQTALRETSGLIEVFFFQKKKQKALFRFAESHRLLSGKQLV
jgi:hypothetical protein